MNGWCFCDYKYKVCILKRQNEQPDGPEEKGYHKNGYGNYGNYTLSYM